MGILDKWYDNYKNEIYNKQYVLMEDGTEKHVTEFNDRSVDNELHDKLRMNSYARDKFQSKLTDEALIETTKHYISNCERYRYPASTYDSHIIHVIVPELIKRLEMYSKYINENSVENMSRLTEEYGEALIEIYDNDEEIK